MSHYAFYNISTVSQYGSNLTFQTIGYISESFVFIGIGLTIYEF